MAARHWIRAAGLTLALATGLSVAAQTPATRVLIETDAGNILVELADDAAPITVANFLRYVDAGQYDGGAFHRAVRLDNQNRDDVLIEVIQGGRSREWWGNGFEPIELERTRDTGLRHLDGTLSMARASSTNSARADFFICINDQPTLDHGGARHDDGQGFAAFGQVIDGMDVVRAIHGGPTERERLTPVVTIHAIRRVE